MVDWSDLQALPVVVKAWGAIWLFLTLGMVGSIRYVLTLHASLVESAHEFARQNLWQVNSFVSRKVDLVPSGSDYITTEQEVHELGSLIGACLRKHGALQSCRKYS